MTGEALRRAVLSEAESWLGTPYHHMGRVQGAGVDCLTLLAEVYERAGLIAHVELPVYRPDFMFHADIETYLEGLLRHGREVAAPEPGDVAIFRRADWRVFGHAGIVTRWPRLIHAIPGRRHGVCRADATQGLLRRCRVKFISPVLT